MILPAMGAISVIIPKMARRPIFGYNAIALSTIAIGVMGFAVWAHHMLTTGIDLRIRIGFMLSTMSIAVPTGIKVFSWTATMWNGRISFKTPMLFAIGFVSMFVIGGISGIWNASVPVDIKVHDTYFIVAHLHYVLFGGSVLGIFAAMYFWFPTFTGRMYHERLGQLHFWLTIIAFNLTFFAMHYLGLAGMPRRVADYADLAALDPSIAFWNLAATLGSLLLAVGQLPFFYNMISSWKRGKRAPEDPWE